MNILLVEYADFMLQIKNCFDSDAKSASFQMESILLKYKRRIPLIRKCYKNINDSAGFGFMKECWFLCASFNWNKTSPFFEGDLRMIQKIFFALYSFVRKSELMEMEMKIMSIIDRKRGKMTPQEA